MILTQEPSAVFVAVAPASIKGNEVPLGHHLYRVLKKVVPNVKVVSPHVVATRVNREGSVSTYALIGEDLPEVVTGTAPSGPAGK